MLLIYFLVELPQVLRVALLDNLEVFDFDFLQVHFLECFLELRLESFDLCLLDRNYLVFLT